MSALRNFPNPSQMNDVFFTAQASGATASARPRLYLTHLRSELLALHEDLLVQLRTEAACIRRGAVADTAEILTSMIAQHERAAATLREQLEHQAPRTGGAIAAMPGSSSHASLGA